MAISHGLFSECYHRHAWDIDQLPSDSSWQVLSPTEAQPGPLVAVALGLGSTFE